MPLLEVYGMPIEANSDGDSMLWSGLMQAVGDSRSTLGIKMSQTPDGRMWRAPSRVNNQPWNSFSRDMALGFILYVQASGDKEMADKWTAYIRRTKGLFPAIESTDTRHVATPPLWWTMSYIGMKVPLRYRITRPLLSYYNKLEFLFTPKGFQTHLKAVTALIMAIQTGKRDVGFGKKLLAREPNNPFFMWLAGKTDEALALSRSLKKQYEASPGRGTQWSWQRTDSENAWKDSMEWDFLFIEKLCNLPIP